MKQTRHERASSLKPLGRAAEAQLLGRGTMTDELILQRQRAAEDARAYLSGKLSWEQFIDRFADNEDELIGDLVDLIQHEPKRGGFLGVNEKQWAQYQSQLTSAISALES